MAYKDNDKGEHPFKKIGEEIKKGELKNLLIFYGREDYLIQWAINEIVNKFINSACKEMDFTHLDGNTVSYTEIHNCCETLTMLSEKRVVLLTDFALVSGHNMKNFPENEEKKLSRYLETLPDTCLMIITADSADKRKKFFKTLDKLGTTYDFCELSEKQLSSFISKRFKAAGKRVAPAVIQHFVETSGYFTKESEYTLLNLDNDIKKIVAYSDGDEVFAADVAKVVAGNIDTNVFAMIDALSRNKKDEAFMLLNNQLMYGENIFKLLALICSQFEIILAVKELKSNGNSLSQIKDILNIHEFRIKKAAIFAERYNLAHLKEILIGAYAVDKNIKTGILEASLALEMFIAQI